MTTSGPVIGDLVTVTTSSTYREAQPAVDRLSDEGFPLQGTRIVGVGLRLVEQVLSRQTLLTATGRGALAGAWFGVLIGLFLGIFTDEALSFAVTVLWALLWGVAAGAIFGLISHALTGGERDFVSASQLAADHYEVLVPAEHADRARALVASPPT